MIVFLTARVFIWNVKIMAGINLLSCKTVYDTKINKYFPYGKS
jgi:hypothetical protein